MSRILLKGNSTNTSTMTSMMRNRLFLIPEDDVFESMDDVLEDEYESKLETEETDWFGGEDPLAQL